MKKTRFVVVDENVLGYVLPGAEDTVNILHASPLRGATVTDLDGFFPMPLDGVRPAVRKDFEDFRVCSEGYEKNPERYDFPTE